MTGRALSELDRLTVDLAFWDRLIRLPVFHRTRKEARAGRKATEDARISEKAVANACANLHLPVHMREKLSELLSAPASTKDRRRPPGTSVSGSWTFERKLHVDFSLEYVEYPPGPKDLNSARTLTEAKVKARKRAEQIVGEEWERLRLPWRNRLRGQGGELERAGRWLADYYVGGESYVAIISKDGNGSKETAKKAVHMAAAAVGIELRCRPRVRLPR